MAKMTQTLGMMMTFVGLYQDVETPTGTVGFYKELNTEDEWLQGFVQNSIDNWALFSKHNTLDDEERRDLLMFMRERANNGPMMLAQSYEESQQEGQ